MSSPDIKIIPALMPERFEDIFEKTRLFDGVDVCMQIDIMDGVFVSTKSWPYISDDQWAHLADVAEKNEMPFSDGHFEAHLMVADPMRIGMLLAKTGIRRLVTHIESYSDTNAIREVIAGWKSAGCQDVCISLLLDTPLSAIEPLLADGVVDSVQVMSIAEIGYQGHPFDERALDRIKELRTNYPALTIAVDGGVGTDHLQAVIDAGATRIAEGGTIMKSADPLGVYKALVEQTQGIING